MADENTREQEHEKLLEEAKAKPGVLEALQLWETTRKHLPSDNQRPKERARRLARGANELLAQPR